MQVHGLRKICLGALWSMSSKALNTQPVSGRVLRHPGAALPAHLQNIFGFAAAAAAGAAKSGGDGLWLLPSQCPALCVRAERDWMGGRWRSRAGLGVQGPVEGLGRWQWGGRAVHRTEEERMGAGAQTPR